MGDDGAKRTWKPLAAGLLLALACLPYIYAALDLNFGPAVNESHSFRPPPAVLVWLPFILPLVVGSVSAWTRRFWGVALIGALLPLVFRPFSRAWTANSISAVINWHTRLPDQTCRAIELGMYIFMLLAAVIVVWSRAEFSGWHFRVRAAHGAAR